MFEPRTEHITKALSELPGEWVLRAACRPTDDWFPEKGTLSNNDTYAVQTCRACPVREQCLEYAVANDEQDGIWGGVNFAKVRKQAKAAKQAAKQAAKVNAA